MTTIFSNGMKKIRFCILFFLVALASRAQESSSNFNFLKLPVSAHAAALGGANVSLIEDDPTLVFNNPALLASVSDNTLNLNYSTYLKGSKMASASYVKILGDRHTLGLTAQYVDYGSMDETTESGQNIGTFSAKDIAFSGLYSYSLNERWVGGATMRLIYSGYADYSSFAIAVDAGLNYFDEDNDFSTSLVLKNVGAQLKSFHDEKGHLPFDLQLGFTKGILHAPIRFSVTLIDLTRWNADYYYHKEGEKDNFGQILLNHFVFGVDIIPTRQFYLSAGYNVRRARELKAAGLSHGAGWSFGGGMQLSRLKLGVAYAKYHVAASSLLFNLSYCL